MRYFSVFSGIGGFEKGIQLGHEELQRDLGAKSTDEKSESSKPKIQHRWQWATVQKGHRILHTYVRWERPVCIGFSEIDKYAIQIYKSHFPDHTNYGDITKINPADLPEFDLLCGGFPCQAFSIAGKRGGFNDTRGTLFFEVARIAHAKRPRLVWLENVKGLLSHDNGRTFATIIATLDELGYDVQWQVLNSKNFGVPQNRERVFIIGHIRGTPRPQVFPIGAGDKTYSREHSSNTIDANYWKGIDDHGARTAIVQLNEPTHSNNRLYGESGIAPTLNTAQGGNRQPKIPDGTSIRRLTPTECERLQGFPDGWTSEVSDTQRYKTIGNAVTVNVIKAVYKKLHDMYPW